MVGVYAQALPCSDANSFPLFCRGQLAVEYNTTFLPNQNGLEQSPTAMTVTIPFTRSTRAGGASGIKLTPGTCSWEDRAVNASEPATVQTFADATLASGMIVQAIGRCAGDSTCVFGGCTSRKGTVLQMLPWDIQVHNQ
jgi:hypothetical protein